MILAFLYRKRGMAEALTGTLTGRLLWWVAPLTILCILLAELYGVPKWLGLLCGLMTWGGISIGHSFAQSNTPTQYAEMGFICFTRMMGNLCPLFIGNLFCQNVHIHMHWMISGVIVGFFFLTWLASWVSYQSFFQSKSLNLFGINWCKPGDSSWEEWLVGLSYDVAFWMLFLTR